ncbi:MAG TPA: leucyl aminopeptidase [Solirubrobacteraceae bacterium]|nr:leucyl aminopeptidase [Solirubrobacteraceae bacterium]
MRVSTTTDGTLDTQADTIAVGAFQGEGIAHDPPGGPLQALLDSGEAGEPAGRLAVTHHDGRRLILVGLGDRERFDAEQARVAAGRVTARALELRASSLCWEVPHHVDDAIVAGLVEGTLLRGYSFDRFKATDAPAGSGLRELLLSAHHDVSQAAEEAATLATAQNRVRDLGNRPANDLTPSALAEYTEQLASQHGLQATVLDEAKIIELGMGAFAAVAQASEEPAKLIRLDYDGSGGEGPLLAMIGKAVTFDTGGLWLKPKMDMHEMKFDMLGGAAVLEAMATLADLEAPVRVMGLVGATENMISGRATRPGDIVTALDGTTIEINNTDAEGRLVLADCITYARREGAKRLIDIATLTGGVVTALGNVYAGVMSNDDALTSRIEQAGVVTGERVWRLPLDERYAEMVRGRYAQITNLSVPRIAQAITAAELLHHFAGDVPWAHLDIAGTAYDVARPYMEGKAATGWGLRLLVEVARTLTA